MFTPKFETSVETNNSVEQSSP